MVLRSQKMISNLFLWVPHFQTNPNPKMGCPQGCTIRIHLRGQEEFLGRRFDPQCLLAKTIVIFQLGIKGGWLENPPVIDDFRDFPAARHVSFPQALEFNQGAGPFLTPPPALPQCPSRSWVRWCRGGAGAAVNFGRAWGAGAGGFHPKTFDLAMGNPRTKSKFIAGNIIKLNRDFPASHVWVAKART